MRIRTHESQWRGVRLDTLNALWISEHVDETSLKCFLFNDGCESEMFIQHFMKFHFRGFIGLKSFYWMNVLLPPMLASSVPAQSCNPTQAVHLCAISNLHLQHLNPIIYVIVHQTGNFIIDYERARVEVWSEMRDRQPGITMHLNADKTLSCLIMRKFIIMRVEI
jgi:hypothetical protein